MLPFLVIAFVSEQEILACYLFTIRNSRAFWQSNKDFGVIKKWHRGPSDSCQPSTLPSATLLETRNLRAPRWPSHLCKKIIRIRLAYNIVVVPCIGNRHVFI